MDSSSSAPVYVPRWTPSPTQTKSLLKDPVTSAGFDDDLEMQSVSSGEEDSTRQMFPFNIAHFTPGPHHLETREASMSSSSSSPRSGSQFTKSFGGEQDNYVAGFVSNREGLFLTWKDLWVTVPDGKKGRRPIIQGLTGYAEPGEMLAIMGPSGCGKSTLLDSLAGRLSSNTQQTGKIFINGCKETLAFGTSAYVTQDDTLMTTLTVREAVYYSAQLQLPDTMSKSEKKERAEMTIKEMGLQDSMDTRIGGWSIKGLSGGQKRRVSICIEILTRPKLLFLDEPTSGLDSAASFHVMSRIVKLACQDGRTVIASIHQPSSEVFELFSNLCLLSTGMTVYFGSVSMAKEFFASNGFPCPTLRNPSDHYLRTINKDFDAGIIQGPDGTTSTAEVINILANSYKSSGTFQEVQRLVFKICQQNGGTLEKKGSQASFITQCLVLTSRSFVNMYRDLGYYWLRLAIYIALCLCVGTIFHDIGFTFGSIQARGSMLMFVAAFLTFMAIGGFPSFVEDMKVSHFLNLIHASEWSVNNFLPTMSENVFKSLQSRYQIPDDIPIRLPEEGERCYSGRTADVGMYDAMFAAELRLPLTALHRQLANFLGISVSQIAPNAWRTFIGAEILWGRLSGGNRQLTLDEFFWCYRPQHISSSKGVYHFAVREKELKLVSDMPDSNRKWKGRYFFVEGTNWLCRQEEWESMPNGFDNTWAYVRDSANNRPRITAEQEDFIRRVTAIPLDERKCRDLITLDTLHLYCGGPEPAEEACKLNAYSCRQMESAKQRVRAAAAAKKKQQEKAGGESTPPSAPRPVRKVVAKRKPDGREDRLGKKDAPTPGDKSSRRPSPPRPVHGAGKGPMTSSGPISQGSVHRLLTHKDYVVEVTESILKDEEIDPCAEQTIDEIKASGLFNLTRAMVRMKALSSRCSAKEGVITRLHERVKYLTDGQAQFKEANRILGTELKDYKEKLTEETCRRELETEAKVAAEKELSSILVQVETARNDAVTEFKDSSAFIDVCAAYYGDGFEDCLKQVKSVYPDLDLSRISMDESIPSTPAGDAVNEEANDNSQRDNSVVLAQPAIDQSVTLTPANPYNGDPNAVSPSLSCAQPFTAEDDGRP